MHDYPDRMSPEQARAFRDSVLNIVSQIPRGRVTFASEMAGYIHTLLILFEYA